MAWRFDVVGAAVAAPAWLARSDEGAAACEDASLLRAFDAAARMLDGR
jgi:hypothetical protein